MIYRDKIAKRFSIAVISCFGVLAFALFFQSCQPNRSSEKYNDVFCSAEKSTLDSLGKSFIISHQEYDRVKKVSLGGYLSNKEAHSGESSVLLTGKKLYAFSTKYKNLKGDEHFIASIWRKDKSKKAGLIVQGDKTYSIYIAESKAVEKGENGWERLEIDFNVPPNIREVTIYAWKIHADSAFFDDLSIQQLPLKVFPAYAEKPKLHLYFSGKKMKEFARERFESFEAGVHIGSSGWKKGVLSDENSVMPIKARLKGDWLDHLRGQTWSYRVKMRKDYAFNRLRVFSLQNPITRYYINEYVSHQLFAQEDVLTPRYGFIPLYLNGKSLGIYAWEEHFAKQLVEYNLRREGPIMKFDENPLWKVHQSLVLHRKWLELPYYETSRVIAFGLSKILEKPVLKKEFNIAQSLMYQYKERLAPVEELFNIDELAKYWAILDVSNGRHGTAWHNQRFYYNPVLCKLEPINYDNYTDYYKEEKPALITALLIGQHDTLGSEFQLLYQIFTSPVMLQKYIGYLEKYSSEAFLNKFMAAQKGQIDDYEEMMQQEFPNYKFDHHFLLENAAYIREKLPQLKAEFARGYFDKIKLYDRLKVSDTTYYPQLISDYVNAFYYRINENEAGLELENYNGRTLKFIGLANKKHQILGLLKQPISMSPFAYHVKDTTIQTEYFDKAAYIVFKDSEHDQIFYTELSLWKKNKSMSPYQELLHAEDNHFSEIFEEQGDSLIVRRGQHSLRDKVMVPSGRKVVFEAGAELDMVHQAAFICYSPIWMKGTADQPIQIYSSDSTANSFSILQSSERCHLSYVKFSHLNTLSYHGWMLSGAVNFYESDVDIDHCSFEHNQCEDALNIVRSHFLVSECSFSDIFSDAFDSDFSKGLLEKTSFDKVGNDAIDFSTGQISIDQCDIKNISDKGVSGGEGSTLDVSNCSILNCNIGIASKDLSQVKVENTTVDHCYYGLVALQKKPEYGPATLDTRKMRLTNCTVKYLIEKNSVLMLNGRKILGVKKNVAKMFY